MTDFVHAAATLRDGFADYHARFRAITQRAQRRFEARDWDGAQGDAVQRMHQGSERLLQALEALTRALQGSLQLILG
jgi:isocitrate dehydrogenase kinase/phosphatase